MKYIHYELHTYTYIYIHTCLVSRDIKVADCGSQNKRNSRSKSSQLQRSELSEKVTMFIY